MGRGGLQIVMWGRRGRRKEVWVGKDSDCDVIQESLGHSKEEPLLESQVGQKQSGPGALALLCLWLGVV